MKRGGVGAIELVAMDLKARGMYLSRTLSYEGADFDVKDCTLPVGFEDIQNICVSVWSELFEIFQEVS
jgi:hypothetical protein